MKTIKVHKDNMQYMMSKKINEEDIVSKREEWDFIFLTVNYV